MAAKDLASLSKPAARDYKSVRNYFEEKSPVSEREQYIYCKEDIITLKPGRENAWLDAVIEKGLKKFGSVAVRVSFSPPIHPIFSNILSAYILLSRNASQSRSEYRFVLKETHRCFRDADKHHDDPVSTHYSDIYSVALIWTSSGW